MDALLVQILGNYLHYSVDNHEPQLGQYYIADWAAKQGYDVKIKIYESSLPIIKDLLHILNHYHCKVIGFYVDSENLWILRRVIPEIKDREPQIKIIIGGPQVTGDPELTLKRVISADIAIMGEGEFSFSEILASNYDFEKLSKINNIIFHHNGKYIKTQPRQGIVNVDLYGFPKRELYSLDPNLKYTTLITGRGCVGRCAFCFEGSKTYNHVRFRNIESVKEEFEYLVNLSNSTKYISFLDDTFIINPHRTKNICDWLITKYCGTVKWFCEARADILSKNVHLIPLMKKAGLIRVQLGGESGCQTILDAYNKNISLRQVEYVVKRLYHAQIPSIFINFIIGGAFETIATFQQTLLFAKQLMKIAPGCVEVGSSLFTPYVGSPMKNHPDQYGIEIIDGEIVRGQDGQIPFVVTKELSEYKIMQLKTLFDNEIENYYKELMPTLSREVIMMHFKLDLQYKATTTWHQQIASNEKLRNYYEAICSNRFVAFCDVNIDEKNVAIPHRTLQPISDGEFYFYKSNLGEFVKFSRIEEQIFMLSSGKLTFGEINNILQHHELVNQDNVDEVLNEIYSKFDKENLIVWKIGF